MYGKQRIYVRSIDELYGPKFQRYVWDQESDELIVNCNHLDISGFDTQTGSAVELEVVLNSSRKGMS